jgi:hypothetical protein
MNRQAAKGRGAYWRVVIARQRASGLSVAAFCRQEEVSPASFYAWRRRLPKEPTPEFVPVSLPETSAEFEVRLPNGVCVVVPGGFAEASLRRLLPVVAAWERTDA